MSSHLMMIQMDALQLIEFITNLGSLFICLCVAILLLKFRSSQELERVALAPLKATANYTTVRHIVAVVAIIGVILDVIILYRTIDASTVPLMSLFIIPLFYFLQLHLTTFSLLYLIHSPKARYWKCWWMYVFVIIWTVVYLCCFAGSTGFDLSHDAYFAFINTRLSAILLSFLLAYDSFILVAYVVTLFLEVRKYRVIVENYFMDKVETNAMVVIKMVYFFLANFVIICVNSLVSIVVDIDTARICGVIVVWINTGVFVATVTVIFNLHNFFYSIAHAFAHEREEKLDALQAAEAQMADNVSIEQQVKLWSSLSSKPYLQEGLTISSVAEEMKVTSRLLSEYLNNILKLNFNSWINSLRVEEIKRILDADDKITMSSLAFQTGFTDASAMSKVFKKFEGISPTAYRRQ